MNISTQRIECPNIERKCYLFYQSYSDRSINKCIGEIVEQENDAGENMFLFKFYYDKWSEFDWENIIVSGIDIYRKEYPVIRSCCLPYFFEGRIPPKERGDIFRTFERLQMNYYDPFEMVMRSRGISQHDNCYVGRTPADIIDLWFYKNEGIMELDNIVPNLPCGNEENDFHYIDKEIKI